MGLILARITSKFGKSVLSVRHICTSSILNYKTFDFIIDPKFNNSSYSKNFLQI